MRKALCKQCFTILLILKKEFSLSFLQIYNVIKIFCKSVIYNIDEMQPEKEYELIICDRSHKYYDLISVKNYPQVIDIAPIYKNKKVFEFAPVLLLNFDEQSINSWCTFHELCHLFSIGTYIKTENRIIHRFGINEYVYAVNDNELILIFSDEHNGMNELINDFVVWRIMQFVYKGNIEVKYNLIRKLFFYIKKFCNENVSVETFVKWYFEGKTAQTKDFLLNQRFDSYEELYVFLNNSNF